jgi:hypothetical protein
MLTENHITDYLAEYLEKQGHHIIKKLTSKQKGIDLQIKKNDGKLLFIEVKGETSGVETSNRFGEYFDRNQIWTHVSVAVMKTMLLMNDPKHKDVQFAMAFPFNHEMLLNRIKPSLYKMEIVVYFVSEHEVKLL